MKPWSESHFNEAFEALITSGTFNEERGYYPRYKARYRELLTRYAAIAPHDSQQVLDIGGGQFALLCKALWGDQGHAADIGGDHLLYLETKGVSTTRWNLCGDPAPFSSRFDFVFFSEVVEHLPVPGHTVLEKIRSTLKPTGTLICSTPNLYRLRNVVYLLLGKQIFDYFRMPTDKGLGHVIEYSKDHLAWQSKRAGFDEFSIEFVQVRHAPWNPVFRVMYALGSPLFLVPRFRDNLIVLAKH